MCCIHLPISGGRPGGARGGDEPLAAFSDNLIFGPSGNLRCRNGNSDGEFPVNRVRPCSWMRSLRPIILILSESLESQWEQKVKTCISSFPIPVRAGVNVRRNAAREATQPRRRRAPPESSKHSDSSTRRSGGSKRLEAKFTKPEKVRTQMGGALLQPSTRGRPATFLRCCES